MAVGRNSRSFDVLVVCRAAPGGKTHTYARGALPERPVIPLSTQEPRIDASTKTRSRKGKRGKARGSRRRPVSPNPRFPYRDCIAQCDRAILPKLESVARLLMCKFYRRFYDCAKVPYSVQNTVSRGPRRSHLGALELQPLAFSL